MSQTYIHGTRDEEQARLSALNKITNDSFMKYLNIDDNLKVCDFGCGLGNLINDISKKYPNTEITGLEISKDQYVKAKEYVGDNKKITLLNVNLYQNNLPNDQFDVTYCRYVLEHVHDPVQAVREMLRTTKKRGRLVCQENDLHNVIYDPEIPGHDVVMEQFCKLQIQIKGDPFIGRKLFSIFHEAGAKKITLANEPEIYTEDTPETYKAWMSNSLNIFLGAKEKLLQNNMITEKVMDEVCSVFRERINNPKGAALFHWNRIASIK